MGRSVLWVLVIVSLSLNVAVAGGYLYAQYAEQTARKSGGMRELAGRLELDAAQRQAGREAQRAMRQMVRDDRARRDALNSAYWTEIARETPDMARLRELVAQQSEGAEALNQQMTERIAGFLSTLTPEQRERFAGLVKDRRIYGGRFLMSGR